MPIVASTNRICSVPYATEDSASEDKIASAFSLLSLCSPRAADFKGLPINSLFIEENMFSPPNLLNTRLILTQFDLAFEGIYEI
jgi:hypothetical protein